MKRAITVATVFAVVAISGASWWAIAGGKGAAGKDATSCDPAACEAGAKFTAASKPSDRVLGHFDLAMAGCRFACATKAKYDAKSVIAQPGAQCPVSGVVFRVDANRPHVRVRTDDYVTCCDTCAEKLRKNPRRFVRT